MALGVYRAATRLQSLPTYETDIADGAVSLQDKLDTITEELRATRWELLEARRETKQAFRALNEKLDHLLTSAENSYESDTAAEGSEEEFQGCQDHSVTDPSNPKTTLVDTTANVPAPEGTRSPRARMTEQALAQVPTGNATSQNQGREVVPATTPAQVSNSRWTPNSVGGNKPAADENSSEFVEKKVKGLLNKLTSGNFASVSDQIVSWANRSENERNAETLVLVIKLVFEKATDESNWAEMYARLCRKMMERISPNVRDDNSLNAAGEPIVGGFLFRKLLLNRCQENFERGWSQAETSSGGQSDDSEPEMLSDEYYTRAKAKRQGIGLVHLIGELFKMQMLTERIIHECIKNLLPDPDSPNEADIESLCKLLTTVGEALDVPGRKVHMDMYFERMQMVAESNNVASRIRYLILDVIELRQHHWRPKIADTEPSMTQQAYEQVSRSNLISVLGRRRSHQPARTSSLW